jgi:hypothetical protein
MNSASFAALQPSALTSSQSSAIEFPDSRAEEGVGTSDAGLEEVVCEKF